MDSLHDQNMCFAQGAKRVDLLNERGTIDSQRAPSALQGSLSGVTYKRVHPAGLGLAPRNEPELLPPPQMRRITVVNRSEDIVNCRAEKCTKQDGDDTMLVFPGASTTLELPSFRVGLILTPQPVATKSSSVDEKWSVAPDGFTVTGPLALTAAWKEVPVPEKCPWLIYRIKVRSVLSSV